MRATGHRCASQGWWQFRAQEADTLAHGDPAFQHEGANLVDDAGALRHQPLAHPVQRLQIQLPPRSGRHELIVGRCTASAIASASLKSFSVLAIGADIFGRQSTWHRDHAMRVCGSGDADQARR